jgi:Zn-dependent protease
LFGRRITLFKMFGFAVRIDVSWLFILVLVVWSLSAGVFPKLYGDRGWGRGVFWAMGLIAAFGFFASIVFHEFCHSLVARRMGIPMKGITLFLFGGVAEMGEEPPDARSEFLMAAAGPVSSAAIAAGCLVAGYVGVSAGWPEWITGVFLWLGFINALLVAFNLVPGFPLDGGRVLRSVLWHFGGDLRRATRVTSRIGGGFGAALVVLGLVSILAADPVGGLWFIVIGLFLRSIARKGYEQVLIRQALEGEPVGRFMSPEPIAVSCDLLLSSLVEDYIYRQHHKMYPVLDGDRLVGCVTTRHVKECPREEWATRTVGEVAEPCGPENVVGPDADAMKALALMSQGPRSRLIVAEDGRLVGVISLKDLLQFLNLKMELEPAEEDLRRVGARQAPEG